MTRSAWPGLAVTATVAVAAMFLSEHYHASAMLFALLLGMSLNFLSQEGKCVEGIQLSASAVLRIGIALLGLRISVGQVLDLGLATAGLVVLSVLLTIGLGVALARAGSSLWCAHRGRGRNLRRLGGAGDRGSLAAPRAQRPGHELCRHRGHRAFDPREWPASCLAGAWSPRSA